MFRNIFNLLVYIPAHPLSKRFPVRKKSFAHTYMEDVANTAKKTLTQVCTSIIIHYQVQQYYLIYKVKVSSTPCSQNQLALLCLFILIHYCLQSII